MEDRGTAEVVEARMTDAQTLPVKIANGWVPGRGERAAPSQLAICINFIVCILLLGVASTETLFFIITVIDNLFIIYGFYVFQRLVSTFVI